MKICAILVIVLQFASIVDKADDVVQRITKGTMIKTIQKTFYS